VPLSGEPAQLIQMLRPHVSLAIRARICGQAYVVHQKEKMPKENAV
jgi:hypothetical protein